jgi:uncharacterized protein
MLLDLNKLQGSREHVQRTFQPSAFDPQDQEYRIAGPVDLSMDVQKLSGNAFGVVGHVRTKLELVCSRCLEPFQVPVDAAFELRYVPQTENTGDGESEIAEDDLTTAYYRDGLLDIADLLREQFQLALPMKPLCSEACRGLCPECGVNLNRSDCGCAPTLRDPQGRPEPGRRTKWEDPRLATLKGLLNRPKEK